MKRSPRRCTAMLLALGSLAVGTGPASALVTVGALEVPGTATDVAIAGDLAYVVAANGFETSSLRVMDVSDPRAPSEIGSVAGLWNPRDVEVSGGRAYVVDESGLRIVDVADPTAPALLGAFALPTTAMDVEVVGDVAYLAQDGFLSPFGNFPQPILVVLDVSDPAAPTELGRTAELGFARDVEIAGTRAYVADLFDGLRVVDVSDPSAPAETGALDMSATALALAGDLAYIAASRLRVADVSPPGDPLLVGEASTPFSAGAQARDVALGGGSVVVSDVDALRVYDASDKSAPVEVGALSATPGGLEVVADLAYVADGPALRIVDLTMPAVPAVLGALDGSFFDVDVVLGVAYLADADSGLRTVDVSDPTAPQPLGDLGAAYRGLGVEVAGPLAYLAAGSDGLRVIDVTDPTAPVEIGALPVPGSASGLDVVGQLVFVAASDAGLRIIDASDPTAPVEIGGLETDRRVFDLAVAGDRAFLAEATLRVVDVSDPSAPALLGGVDGFGALGVAVEDQVAYTAGFAGLPFFDVSDPAAPLEIARPPGDGRSFEVRRARALLASDRGLRVFAVEDPGRPLELGGVPGSARALDLAGGLVYLAGTEGLRVVELGSEYAGLLEVAIDIEPGDPLNRVDPLDDGAVAVALLGSEALDVTEVDTTTLAFGPAGATPLQLVCEGDDRPVVAEGDDDDAGRSRGDADDDDAGSERDDDDSDEDDDDGDDCRPTPFLADVDGDGEPDLVSHYRVAETGLVPGDTQACLSGLLADGTRLEGCDAVWTWPRCGLGFELALGLPLLRLLRRRRGRAA